jgi:hypothetical protein
MEKLELSKKLLTGIFDMNNELREIDDSIFILVIKSGIEKAANGDKEIYNELLEHAVDLYTAEWLRQAVEDDDDIDLGFEKSEAKRAFMKFFGIDI